MRAYQILGLCLAPAIAASIWFQQSSKPNQLIWDTCPLHIGGDLGTRHETAATQHTLTITNQSSNPIFVSSIVGNCDCLQMTPSSSFSIPPGATQPVEITLALRMVSGCQKQQGKSEQLEFPIQIGYSSPGKQPEQLGVLLTCRVLPALRLSKLQLSYGMISTNQQEIESIVDVEVASHVGNIAVSGSDVWAVHIPHDLCSTTQKGQITFRMREPLVPASFDNSITLTPFSHSGQALPASTIRLTGEVVSDVIAVPREIRLGRIKLNAIAEDIVSWESLTKSPFTVRSVQADHPSVTVTPVKLEGNRPGYRITKRMTTYSEEQHSLRVEIVEHNGKVTLQQVPITAIGY